MTAPISAVIPCHNGAAFLGEAIASVQRQHRPVAELIVVDDASTDGSGGLARSLGARVIELASRSGNAAARNVGLRAATHELVALLDADDRWLPPHCELLAPLLERYPEAAAAFSALEVIGNGTGVHRPWIEPGPPQWLFERCLETWVGQPSACLLRREAALAVGGFDESLALGVDFDLWLRLAPRFPFVATQAITAQYRRHPAQISNAVSRQTAFCYQARRRAWDRLVEAGDHAAAARAADIIRRTYGQALQRAWDTRELEVLRELVALAPLVPESGSLARRWGRRARIPRLAHRVWSWLGEGIRDPIRKSLRRVERDEPRQPED